MDITLLSGIHATYTDKLWAHYDALYRGGEAFRACLNHFLPRNPQEADEIYLARKSEAHFTGYVGPIVDWFAAKLFSASIVVRATGEAGAHIEADSFYADWKEDVDGAGTDLVDFARSRFTTALVKGRAWWCVELPDDGGASPATRAEWESRQLGQARVRALEPEQILDLEVDDHGEIAWAIVHTLDTPRADWRQARGRIRETWQVYDRTAITTFAIEYDPTKNEPRPTEAVLVSERPHGFSRVPLVCLGFVSSRGVRVRVGARVVTVSSGALEGFWLISRLADPQIAHFRNSAALDWNIKRTCYAMPVFEVGDDTHLPKMGVGYWIQLAPGDKASWLAPPTEHLSALASRVEHLKDEIYRVAMQMAQGVSNNAASIGRSGESKAVDLESTEVVLRVYGAVAREAIERTYDLLAEGRSDVVDWSIEGLDVFGMSDAAGVVEAALNAQALAVPSATFRRELMYRVADAFLPNADQATKDAIRSEIEAGVTAEETAPPPKVEPAEDDLEDEVEDDERSPASTPKEQT